MMEAAPRIKQLSPRIKTWTHEYNKCYMAKHVSRRLQMWIRFIIWIQEYKN